MKKVVYVLMALAILLAFVPAVAIAHTEADPFVTDLLAGQYMDVGDVLVWNDADMLYVKYVIGDPAWCITATHLQVATSPGDLPQTKRGNAIPGQFEENDEHDCVTEVIYTYNLAERGWSIDTELFIAAHADVLNESNIIGYTDEIIGYTDEIIGWDCPTLDDLAAMLPESVGIKAVNYPNDDSYFDLEFTGDLVGTFPTWCIDETHTIYLNTNYTANLYSSFEPIPDYLTTGTDPNIDHPENLDLVNWVVNNSDGYTSAEVQNVIWGLIDDNLPALTVHELDLYNAALANGEGFVPDFAAGDVFTIVVAPVTAAGYQATIAQVTLSELGVECIPVYQPIYQPIYQTETAWGEGTGFPGEDWSMYFIYTVQGELPPVEWPLGGTTTVAFEDLPLGGGNDWDYNDWVADIYTEATYWGTTAEPGTDLIQMAFTVTPQAKLAGYHHVMHFDSDTFGCDGTYELTRDGVPAGSGSYDDAVGLDVILIPDTNLPNEATLTIMFDPPCAFDWSAYDPYGSYHGEGLFFDPWIEVINTGEAIHQGDVRMLTVPTDWVWPAESQAIWLAYPKVGPVTDPYAGPVFGPYWWTP